MLAKIWKKLLLAICIIAILFNITAKLVNRISLEKAISSAPEGVNIREFINITEDNSSTSNKKTSNISRYKTIEEVEAERAKEESIKEKQENKDIEYIEQNIVDDENLEQNITEVEFIEEEQEEESNESNILDMITEKISDVKM